VDGATVNKAEYANFVAAHPVVDKNYILCCSTPLLGIAS
jgi:hypothetical protein